MSSKGTQQKSLIWNSTTQLLKLAIPTAMQAVKLARNVFQVDALAIFAYQMVGALEKYFSFNRISFMDTKDIDGTEMPSIFICPAKQDLYQHTQNTTEHGYLDLRSFLRGNVNSSVDFVSWEGIKNLSHNDISRQQFNSIEEWKDIWIDGEPLKN